MPSIEPYDDSFDPVDHLEEHKALMRFQGMSDALLCLAFLVTVKKVAKMWFSSLLLGSIHSF